ncbi:ABC zinc transporter%2C metal-binding lipoprotein [Streptococcus pneumoniae]|nr:ABC zinc transporter%2C metal-binding lipoprotein [Streptococcus pneumoniae]
MKMKTWKHGYAIKLVEHIRDSLSADYPDKKETFEKNAAAYIEKLQALDKAYAEGHQGWRKLHFRDGEKPQGFETNNRPRRPSNRT